MFDPPVAGLPPLAPLPVPTPERLLPCGWVGVASEPGMVDTVGRTTYTRRGATDDVVVWGGNTESVLGSSVLARLAAWS